MYTQATSPHHCLLSEAMKQCTVFTRTELQECWRKAPAVAVLDTICTGKRETMNLCHGTMKNNHNTTRSSVVIECLTHLPRQETNLQNGGKFALKVFNSSVITG